MEIKFRGKRIGSEKWVFGNYIKTAEGNVKHWIVNNSVGNGGWLCLCGRYPIKGETIGQYIGIPDENGVDIYTGDIMDQSLFADDPPCPFEVVFEDYAFRKKYSEWDSTLPKPILTQYEISLLGLIVIGNVHDKEE